MSKSRVWPAIFCAPLLVAAIAPVVAHAQNHKSSVAGESFHVALPAQPLDRALIHFSRITGAQFMFNDVNVTRTRAPAVRGTFTLEELLRALLAGTGYTYRFTDERTVRVFPAHDKDTRTRDPFEQAAVAPSSPAAIEEVVVAGSYLPDTMAINPVSVVGRAEMSALGVATLGEMMRAVSSNGSAEFNDQNEGPNDARGDVGSANLRELGAGNTLILLNGRRVITHPVDQAVGSVPTVVANLNMIPIAAIDRIEILRDGASALYGADATAGVINVVLTDSIEGVTISPRFGAAENTSLQELGVDFAAGMSLGEGRSQLNLFGSLFRSSGYVAAEQPRTADADLRRLVPEHWRLNDEFDGRSSRAPFGEFQTGSLDPSTGEFTSMRVRRSTSNVTSSDGRFHIQPVQFDPGDTTVYPHAPGVELDDGSLPGALYYNTNEHRGISAETERIGLLSTLDHQFNAGLAVNAELSLYRADSFLPRSVISLDQELGNIVVPRTNYYNPFGAVTSAHRLPGIDAPAEGLDVLVRRYRPIEMGRRSVDVSNRVWRALVGVSGHVDAWRWDTALLQSEARNQDRELNRIARTLLEQQLALSTPDAFNPFGGGYVNSRATLDAVRVSIQRDSKSSLRSWDLRLVNASLAPLPGGDIGLAAGLDWRWEAYWDDRDSRVDGTRPASNGDPSDVIGVSATPDSDGSRQARGGFVELRVPIVGETNALRAAHRLDLQIAGRYEYLDDIGEGVFAPKLALGWQPLPAVLIRASYGEGFQAPNLVLLNHSTLTRLNSGQEDFWRSDVTGLPEDTGANSRTSTREGNPDLELQRSRTYILGLAYRPQATSRFSVTLDYWRFEQNGVVDNFGVENQLALDFLLRKRGSFNPYILRAAPTAADLEDFAAWNAANPDDQRAPVGAAINVIDPYLNLQPRTARGLDIALSNLSVPVPFGTLEISLEATRLLELSQKNAVFNQLRRTLADSNLNPAEAAIIFDEIGAAIDPDRIGLNGNPRWKALLMAEWSRGRWSAGAAVQYVGDFIDASARNPRTGEFWQVDDWLVVNSHLEYGFASPWLDRLRVGVRNLFDSEPPLADEDFGFFSNYHDAKGRFYYLQLFSKF